METDLKKLAPPLTPAKPGTKPESSATVGRPRSAGVYVHFPWCLQKCPYCDFLSIARPRDEIPHERYADQVCREIRQRAPSLGTRSVHSVFIGGGTPSLWKPAELGRVLDAIFRELQLAPDVEVTAECNPSSFSDERARELRAVGVNRISLGVQGLDRERLEFLGRLHDGPGGLAAIRQALGAGFPRVSADLIYGVYGQPADRAAHEAATVAATGVRHLSAYALTVEPQTSFGAREKRGTLPLLPDDVVAESFTAVHETLEDRGLLHYEISNFAQPGHECRHNLGYWRGEPYLGLGTGAWGTLHRGSGALRYRNTPSPERYLSLEDWAEPDPDRSNDALHAVERLDASTRLCERLLLGLRLREGLDPSAVEAELGVPFFDEARRRATDRLLEKGELEFEAGRLRIPVSAWLFADRVIRELL